MRDVMLTTIDNPYDPFTQFDEWFLYDETKGHHSCQLLARVAKTANDLPDSINAAEIESAIDRIIRLDPELKYKKVVKEVPENDTD